MKHAKKRPQRWRSVSSVSRSKGAIAAPSARTFDEGFTLIELLLVLLIVPVMVGTVSLSLVSVLRTKSQVTGGLNGSASQLTSTSLLDVQSATQFTTSPTPTGPAACGTSSEILGLSWSSSASTTTIVSYGLVRHDTMNGATSATEDNLVRYLCTSTNGGPPTLTSTSVLSRNVSAGLVAVATGESCTTTLCSTALTAGATGWASAVGLQNINLVVSQASTESVSYDR